MTTPRTPTSSRRTPLAVLGLLAAAILLLTACEQAIGTDAPVAECPGPHALSADGRWVLTAPAKPGPVRTIGRGDADGTVRQIFAEGYGTAVNADGSVVTAHSRRANSGVVWRQATGEHTVLPMPGDATVVIPTSIDDSGRHVGVTASVVPGGPSTGHIYDTHTGHMTAVPGAESITQLLLTRSGDIVYVAGTDGVIRRIDRVSGTARTVAEVSPLNPEPIESVTRLGRLVVYNTAPDNRAGRLRIWDASTGTVTGLPAPLRDGVAFDRVRISGDGTRLTATVHDPDGTTGEVIGLTRTDGTTRIHATVIDSGRPVISGDGSVTVYCRTDGADGDRRVLVGRVESD